MLNDIPLSGLLLQQCFLLLVLNIIIIIIIMEHRKKVWLRNENYLVIVYCTITMVK